MNDYFPLFQSWLLQHPQWLGLSILVISFVESLAIAGLIVPGVALLFLVATLAGGGALSLQATLIMGFAGAVTGDGLSFLIGRIFQKRIPEIWPFNRYPRVMVTGQQFFLRHGGKSIIFGRFIGPVRPVVPLIAGMMNMPPGQYFICNFLSALAWAPFYLLPGYLVGASLQSDIHLPPHFWGSMTIALTSIAATLWLFLHLQARLKYESPFYLRLELWMQRYNQTHRFWRQLSNQRSDQRGEFPLNSLMLLIVTAGLFVLLSLVVVHTPWLTKFDHSVLNFSQELRHPWLDRFFVALTLAGDPEVFYVGFALGGLVLWLKGHTPAMLHLLAGGIIALVGTHALKAGFAIPRPDVAIQAPGSMSYPSGHASGTTLFYSLLATFIGQELSASKRRFLYLAMATPILLVTVSRVYLGVHWLTDVAGGILFGLMISAAVRVSFSRYDRAAITPCLFVWAALGAFTLFTSVYVGTEMEGALQRYGNQQLLSPSH